MRNYLPVTRPPTNTNVAYGALTGYRYKTKNDVL
jgi:hypothetical protein